MAATIALVTSLPPPTVMKQDLSALALKSLISDLVQEELAKAAQFTVANLISGNLRLGQAGHMTESTEEDLEQARSLVKAHLIKE